MLTRKQYELLVFIDKRLKETGVSPSFDEMKDALDLRSKSGVHRLITGLEERGFIRRLPHRARALEVLKLPENFALAEAPPAASAGAGFSPKLIKGDFKVPGVAVTASEAEAVHLPLYGKIAAGLPIEALNDYSETADVPASLIGPGEFYALQVEGDSMIDAGILDGDTVVIRRCDTADNGSIVVALVVDDNEVTLKRLRRKGASIALEPANKTYETRIYPPGRHGAAYNLASRNIQLRGISHVLCESHILGDGAFRENLETKLHADRRFLALGVEMQVEVYFRSSPDQPSGVGREDVAILAQGIFVEEQANRIFFGILHEVRCEVVHDLEAPSVRRLAFDRHDIHVFLKFGIDQNIHDIVRSVCGQDVGPVQ